MSVLGHETPQSIRNFGETDYRPLVQKCASAYDVFRLLRSISVSFGYSHFQTIDMPQTVSFSLFSLSVVSNWPAELVNAIDAHRLFENNAILDQLSKSTEPVVWRLDAMNAHLTGERRELADEVFRDFGLIGGVYFSVHTAQGVRGAVSFAGKRCDPSTSELMELSFLSSLIYERLKLFSNAEPAADKRLSKREIQCLQWTAAGKTSLEIALILELSDHTVNHYLSSVCQKLGAQNRAHMVSKAMRMGLLQ